MALSGSRRSKCAENRAVRDKQLPTGKIIFHFGVQSLTKKRTLSTQGQLSLIFQPEMPSMPPVSRPIHLRTVKSGTKEVQAAAARSGARGSDRNSKGVFAPGHCAIHRVAFKRLPPSLRNQPNQIRPPHSLRSPPPSIMIALLPHHTPLSTLPPH